MGDYRNLVILLGIALIAFRYWTGPQRTVLNMESL